VLRRQPIVDAVFENPGLVLVRAALIFGE